jgi:hypothetical protein
MAVYEHGKRIAELIIQSQDIAYKLKQYIPSPPIIEEEKPVFVELPKPLHMFYNPHQSLTVNAGDRATVWFFSVPTNHIFHIEQIGTNWYPDTYLLFEVDGSQREKIERFYGEINAPLDVRHRYITARHDARWIAVNNSDEDVVYDVLMDGTIYHIEDWPKMVGRF